MYKKYFKRCIDFTIAFLVLAIIGWFIVLVAIMLHFANKGAGAFFLQERPGKDGKPFKVMKFKTMTDERGADGELLPDIQRITKIGKLVRSLSIDELPQFINVFKGDMSLIGPRPLLMHYLPWYTLEQARRHEVRPGITGWAQVNGRNHCKLSKKIRTRRVVCRSLYFSYRLENLQNDHIKYHQARRRWRRYWQYGRSG